MSCLGSPTKIAGAVGVLRRVGSQLFGFRHRGRGRRLGSAAYGWRLCGGSLGFFSGLRLGGLSRGDRLRCISGDWGQGRRGLSRHGSRGRGSSSLGAGIVASRRPRQQ